MLGPDIVQAPGEGLGSGEGSAPAKVGAGSAANPKAGARAYTPFSAGDKARDVLDKRLLSARRSTSQNALAEIH